MLRNMALTDSKSSLEVFRDGLTGPKGAYGVDGISLVPHQHDILDQLGIAGNNSGIPYDTHGMSTNECKLNTTTLNYNELTS